MSMAVPCCLRSLAGRRRHFARRVLAQPLVRAAASRASVPAGNVDGSLAQVTRVSGPSSAQNLSATWLRRQAHSKDAHAQVAGRLSNELEQVLQENLPRDQHLNEKAVFLKELQGRLAAVVDGAKVLPFGSAVNGLWTPQSDVDVCVRAPGATTRNGQIQILRKIAGELKDIAPYHIEPRFGAQVPILHWAPRSRQGVACDISVNNILAVANSRLLRSYMFLDPRARTLGFSVKMWASARGINDRSKGTLSSFALALMTVNFLQHRTPPILPSLQDLAFSRSSPPVWIAGVDTRYCTDSDEIKQEMEFLRAGRSANSESPGSLLLDFFRHYAHDYRRGTIRIRDSRSVLPRETDSGTFLQVDNPFEVGKDVANVDQSQQDTIRQEFRRGWRLLSQGHSFQDLLNPQFTEASRNSQAISWN